MSLKNKKIMLLIVFVASIVTIVGTISYAYFTSSGVSQNQDASLQTGSMVVRFADNDSGLNQKLEFGQTVTKKFTITNSGTLEAKIRLGWEGLKNTYTEGSLTYKLSYSETEDGEYTEVVPKTNVPVSPIADNKILVEQMIIPANTTYYCNLDITLNYLEDVNQDADLSAVFTTMFSVADVTSPVTLQVTFDAGGGTTTQETKTVTRDLAYGELPKATRSGYAFGGWYTSETGGTKVTAETIVTEIGSHKLYARWLELGSDTTLMVLKATSKGVKSSFDSIATTDEGIYEMTDNYGKSYYYRGAVENNYVKFGKNKDGADMYWRIIRVNGDGSLRMIYDGTSAHANGEASDDRLALTGVKWNPNYDDAKYVGYMFGGADGVASTSKAQAQTNQTNSNIKTNVDAWYKENIVDTGYSEYISDEIFCNDRSTPGKSVSQWSSDTGLGYAKNGTTYGAFGRFMIGNNGTSFGRRSNPSPKFTCSQKNDAFTVSDTERGNGALTYPVGLITADEIISAGGRYYMSDNSSNNDKYYLYKSSSYLYWSISPFFVLPSGSAYVFGVSSTGDMIGYSVSMAGVIAPVINLSAGYSATLEGAGTMSDPFILGE